MSDANRLSRRQLLRRTAAAAAGGVVMPVLIPSAVLAAPGANERIGVGYIGVGRRGSQLMRLPKEGQVVAAVDLDPRRVQSIAGRWKCKAFADYRKMLEQKDVDAVVVATPDHWHALASIHACQAGKDVYTEKPLSLTVREGRAMVEAARKYKRVFQTGSQRRSMRNHRVGVALVRNGRIGKVTRVIAHNYPSPWEARLPGQPVPEGLDWDVWCGQTRPVPFHNDIYVQRSNPGWISLRRYSGGEVTGNGAHGLDQIQWAMNADDGGPLEFWTEGEKLDAPVYTAPQSRARGNAVCSKPTVFYRYANGVTVELGNASACGAIFIGQHGKIIIGCNEFSSEPAEIAREPLKETDDQLYVANNHMQNWFDCIKSRKRPTADVAIGHRSAVVCHLVNIARWTGRRLKWDPAREIFAGDDEANTYLERPMRKPYELPEVV